MFPLTLNSLDDCATLLDWARTTPGVGVAVVTKVDGDVYVQLDGVNVETRKACLGDTVDFTEEPVAFTVTAGVSQ